MPKLTNIERNVVLEIELLKNKNLDIKRGRIDTENWIPFELYLSIGNNKIAYNADKGAAFTVYEVKNLVTRLNEIIKLKISKKSIERYEFSSSECYFDMIVYDPLEENEVYMEIWVNNGALTDGKEYGFDKGYRFAVLLESIITFTNELHQQIDDLANLS